MVTRRNALFESFGAQYDTIDNIRLLYTPVIEIDGGVTAEIPMTINNPSELFLEVESLKQLGSAFRPGTAKAFPRISAR